jgi:hypothetical protein
MSPPRALVRSVLLLVTSVFCCGAAPARDSIGPLHPPGGVIDIELSGSDLNTQELSWWIHAASDSVVHYYGRFPVAHLALQVMSRGRSGIGGGMTFGRENGGYIRVGVGSDTSLDDLRKDWVLTHEMVHLALPDQPRQHHWIEEGIATYVEPIARMQAGYLKPEKVWGDMMRDMSQGLPQPGDQGLDNTHTWANTYWGGALFCLVADVRIRQQTHNAKGLQDALRGILSAGGNLSQSWDLLRTLQAGDSATETHVLEQLYDSAKDKPMSVDLEKLWQDLGVRRENGVAVFNEKAPLAAVRRSITAGKRER